MAVSGINLIKRTIQRSVKSPIVQVARRNMSGKTNKKFTVAVEGNIASGKTTFLQYFEKFREVQVLQEPVDLWRNVKGHNLLDLMYKDPTRWSLTFQTYVQLTMIKAHLQPQSAPVKLMERSLLSAKYCFVENLHRRGFMPNAEYVVLTEWFDWLTANLDIGIDLVVYLRTSPEVVGERIRRRNRSEEQGVPMEYLKQLHELHEDWLIHQSLGTLGSTDCRVLVLDANQDAEEMCVQYETHKSLILGTQTIDPLGSAFSQIPGDTVTNNRVVVKTAGELTCDALV